MPVPVHELASTEDFLAVLDGHPTKFAAGTAFSYCNGGFVVLALLAERASGMPYHDLVRERVCEPAGMSESEFLRSDELPAGAAVGYLRGGGAQDERPPPAGSRHGRRRASTRPPPTCGRCGRRCSPGRIVSAEWVAEMTRPRSDASGWRRYGLGFWLHRSTETVILEGYDAGVSFQSLHDPTSDTTCTVISNWSDGAWPVAEVLGEPLFG